MGTADHYQAIVIGSGQGGTPLCSALAGAGLRTALIERAHVAGTCINEGCTPTKTMVASARVAYLARRGGDYGVRTGRIEIDMQRVRARKRDIVEHFRTATQVRLERTANLDLICGEASFTAPKALRVRLTSGSQRTVTGDWIFINVGGRPSVPGLDGLKDVPYLDSTSIMEMEIVPEHLLIIGGGYVGLEFAQMFRRFGSHVTIVQAGAQLLSNEDADVAHAIGAMLTQDGIDVLLNARATSVARTGDQIQLTGRTGADSLSLTGSHLLVATGRVPNTDALNLPAAGVATDDRGFVQVNEKLETSQPGVFALGDAKGGPAFTHISYDDFRVLRTNLIERGNATITGRLVPYTVFTDPELGRIGLTEAQARAQNKQIRVAKMPMTSVARALETDESRGFMKALVDATSGHILGAAVFGIEGGEIMSMLELAMIGKLTYEQLRDAIFAHPTVAESLNNLFVHFDS